MGKVDHMAFVAPLASMLPVDGRDKALVILTFLPPETGSEDTVVHYLGACHSLQKRASDLSCLSYTLCIHMVLQTVMFM